jgi:hypothetical protein
MIRTARIIALLFTPTVVAFHQRSSAFLGGSTINPMQQIPKSSSQLCMKTIAVFGSSGLTASECVYQALQNGDTVIGLTRYVAVFIFGFGPKNFFSV